MHEKLIKSWKTLKSLYKESRKHATKIINYEKREMIPLIYEENKSYKKQKVCYMCKREFKTEKW